MICLLGLSGVMYPQLIGHVGQHDHHQATTHGTALCSWVCVSADFASVGTAEVFQFTTVERSSTVSFPQPSFVVVLSQILPRAPPSFSVFI